MGPVPRTRKQCKDVVRELTLGRVIRNARASTRVYVLKRAYACEQVRAPAYARARGHRPGCRVVWIVVSRAVLTDDLAGRTSQVQASKTSLKLTPQNPPPYFTFLW